jgi:SAM-dependent methyltransferase
VDISPMALERARARLKGPRLSQADGELLPFRTGQFAGVACLGSLEHYLRPEEGLREIQRVMSDDGVAAVALPNSYYLVDIIWQVWRTGHGPDHKQLVQRFATVREWEAFLENGGLRVLRTYKHNFRFPRCRADLRWYRSYPRKALNLLIAPLVPFNLSNSFVFICGKQA